MKPTFLPVVALLALSTCSMRASVKDTVWYTSKNGDSVNLYTLEDRELRVQLTDYGARIVSIEAPDRDGRRTDIVLGFDDAAQYLDDPKAYFGATIGRFSNRLAKGSFSLDGHVYHVPLNNNANAMHGGPQGFSASKYRTGGHGIPPMQVHAARPALEIATKRTSEGWSRCSQQVLA